MKTLEDKAQEYAVMSGALDAGYSVETEEAYMQGARDAQEWISVNDELPVADTPCIVRNENCNIRVCFMRYRSMSDGTTKPIGWFNYLYDGSSTRTSEPIRSEVTHWRYVERY